VTQERARFSSPSGTVAERIKRLRKARGWSAEQLAEACADAGMPELNRSVIANIESRRRKHVTVEEALALAYVLDVAPVHLFVPIDTFDGDDWYMAAPDRFLPVSYARVWVRGEWCPPGCDPRTYFSEVPAEEFRPERPSEEKIAERGQRLQEYRELEEQVKEAQARWREQQRGER
jgi:transcriptional regulator with XRE-family HTH domain